MSQTENQKRPILQIITRIVTSRNDLQFLKRKILKEAGAFEAPGQTKEELWANGTSRHPKVFKLGAEHGCQ